MDYNNELLNIKQQKNLKRPDKSIFNNSLLTKETVRQCHGDNNYNIDIHPLKDKSIITTAYLSTKDKNIEHFELTPYDLDVIDAISTLYYNGYTNITYEMIIKVKNANFTDGGIGKTEYRLLDTTIDKLMTTTITIDFTEEFRKRGIKTTDISATRKYNMIYASVTTLKRGDKIYDNKKIKRGEETEEITRKSIQLYDYPIWYKYNALIGQVLYVDTELLEDAETTGKKKTNRPEYVTLTRYLIRKINELTYYGKTELPLNTIISDLFYNRNNDNNDMTDKERKQKAATKRQQKRRLIKQVDEILDKLQEKDYIVSHQAQGSGSQTVFKVQCK